MVETLLGIICRQMEVMSLAALTIKEMGDKIDQYEELFEALKSDLDKMEDDLKPF